MAKKISQGILLVVFFVMLAVPLLTANFSADKTASEDENRMLAAFPAIRFEDGTFNGEFTSQFEDWINDNLGFRSEIVAFNAKMQYDIFNRLDSEKYVLGPRGELNYIGDNVMENYRGRNLYSDDELADVTDCFKTINDYCNSLGIQFYYMQNWDKQSIFPEKFSKNVLRQSSYTIVDQVVNSVSDNTDITVISTKDTWKNNKNNYEIFSTWGDVSHCTERAAYLGYLDLMKAINERNGNMYRVLDESDYIITKKNMGQKVSGSIYKPNWSEHFEIATPTSWPTNEKFKKLGPEDGGDPREMYYTNYSTGNETTILIFGDSYTQYFNMDDLAESFHDTILLWSWTINDLPELIDIYDPDIIVYEKAERIFERDASELKQARDLIHYYQNSAN